MVGIIKIGFWTMLAGALSIVFVMMQGVGPCGPRSLLGAFILLGGTIAAVFGFLTLVVAFAWHGVRQRNSRN